MLRLSPFLAVLCMTGCPRSAMPDEGAPRVPKPSGATLRAGNDGVSFAASGCAADPQGGQASAATVTGQVPDSVRVDTAPGALTVTHQLTHLCCLKAAAEVDRRAGEVLIVERMSGSACRCQCGSTLVTTVKTPPGATAVRVVVSGPSGEAEAYSGMATVP